MNRTNKQRLMEEQKVDKLRCGIRDRGVLGGFGDVKKSQHMQILIVCGRNFGFHS